MIFVWPSLYPPCTTSKPIAPETICILDAVMSLIYKFPLEVMSPEAVIDTTDIVSVSIEPDIVFANSVFQFFAAEPKL